MTSAVESYVTTHGFDLDQLRERLLLAPSEIAYVTGSLLDDVGDSASDLDVYVLTDEAGMARRAAQFTAEERGQQLARGFGMFYVQVGAVELDVECHPITKLDALLDALDAYRPNDRDSVRGSYAFMGRFARDEAVELLHRLRIAQPLAGGEAFARLRGRIDDAKYLAWNVTHYMILAEAAGRGVARNLAGGDAETAYLMLCSRFDALADAYLFARGTSLDRWKWRLKKLRALGESEMLARYLDVHLAVQREDLAAFVRAQYEVSLALADDIRLIVGEDRCIMRKI